MSLLPLVYEIAGIAASALSLLGVIPEYGYWYARSRWRLTEGDMVHGTIAAASLWAAALIYTVQYPAYQQVQQPGTLLAMAVFMPVRRTVEWIHGEWWFLMLRLTLLGVILAIIGSIILSAPTLLSQDHMRAGQLFDLEVRTRAMEINNERLNARLDNLTAQVAEIKENIIWARNAMFTLLGGVAIFLIKEFLMLLKGVLPSKPHEE